MSTAIFGTQRPKLPQPFQSSEHEPFYWNGGEDAVLLVHGFPGTPAEMRPLAQHLHAQGWTTRGILLPGLGPELHRLVHYTQDDWQQAVNDAVDDLSANHRSVVIIGNSIGAMLALRCALHVPLEALVLIAPFWRVEHRWLDFAFPLIKPFVRYLQPFRQADFADPEFRKSLKQVWGDEIDLGAPCVQSAIRHVPMPVSALAHVRHVGRAGYAAARSVYRPVCIVQGSDDSIAISSLTQRFALRLPHLGGYVAVHGDHDLARQQFQPGSPMRHFINQFLTIHAQPRIGQVRTTYAN